MVETAMLLTTAIYAIDAIYTFTDDINYFTSTYIFFFKRFLEGKILSRPKIRRNIIYS